MAVGQLRVAVGHLRVAGKLWTPGIYVVLEPVGHFFIPMVQTGSDLVLPVLVLWDAG